MTDLSADDLAALRRWPTPAISNAIETFDIRGRERGFMSSEIVCRYPEMAPMVGYAATCTIRASIPGEQDVASRSRSDWWEFVESIPAPRVIVIQDLDQPAIGSFWGEVNANIHRALGAVGVITDGGVRDLEEVRELGFQFLSQSVLVSHAYVHIVEIGGAVRVGGLTVQPGDLMHADLHGAMQIPLEIAKEVSGAAQLVEDRERVVIDYAKSPEFTRAGLAAATTNFTAKQEG